jgi:hypothetical protein
VIDYLLSIALSSQSVYMFCCLVWWLEQCHSSAIDFEAWKAVFEQVAYWWDKLQFVDRDLRAISYRLPSNTSAALACFGERACSGHFI